MDKAEEAERLQMTQEIAHWTMAASRLEDLDSLASPDAWDRLERYLGLAIRRRLGEALERLQELASGLHTAFQSAQSEESLERVRRQLVAFRHAYLRTETTLDFYADAINTRTNPEIAALLRACDALARRSMAELLDQLGKPTPHVLTYLDKGLGASILKADLRLWDGGTINPAAAIKIVRHNLYHPTALIHEAGHQVAHITNWNDELAAALQSDLAGKLSHVAEVWGSWASEIAADAFAFVHTGYAAVIGLYNVVGGDAGYIFRYIPGDPHPISYIRVLLGTHMCRHVFGAGPWDELAQTWQRSHPLARARPGVQRLLERSFSLLPRIVEIILRMPMRAFGGRPLTTLIDPSRVKPAALYQLERQVGPALYTSSHWVQAECLRLLALTGFQAATLPDQAAQVLKQQEAWMIRLGA